MLLNGFKWIKRYQKQSKENGAHKISLEVIEAHIDYQCMGKLSALKFEKYSFIELWDLNNIDI